MVGQVPMMAMEDVDLIELKNQTTIVKVIKRNESRGAVNWDQGQQISFQEIESDFKKIFDSFGRIWTEERQHYRFLYDTVKLFYNSFRQLRRNKVQCLDFIHEEDNSKLEEYSQFASTSLHGVYTHGKKCCDLLKKLNLLEESDEKFVRQFSESRNKLIEHNFNPSGFNFLIDPDLWSLVASNSDLSPILWTQS